MLLSNVNVYGLAESMIASGYPMLAKPLSEEEFLKEASDLHFCMLYPEHMKDNKHFKRMCKLASAPNGSGHNNALKGIIVQFDLEAPRYFWNQLQRYNFVDFVSSMSQMHRIKELDLGKNADICDGALMVATQILEQYEKGEITIDECLANMPQGLEITARLSTNYLQLRTIYSQRKTHRSRHWREFCAWVETLPYAKEFIIN